MGSPASPFSAIARSPIVDTNRIATYTFLKLLQDWNSRINNLGSQGQYNGLIESTATIGGRAGNIGSALANLDQNGVVTANGIDFTRNYLNKTFANINGSVAPGQLPQATTATQGAVVLPTGAVSNVLGSAAIQPTSAFDASGAAAAAQTAAQAFAANGSNISSGTVAAARLPALSALSGQITGGQLPASGLSVTIATAKLTSGGTNGSMTFTNGILTAHTDAT